ncbi:MAG: hypothetical protein ACD_12C00256G0001 [uncultured bacterium]|nr:MAG: hypothetical protein ACD_12C00256G0001 [uncultured bacterium]
MYKIIQKRKIWFVFSGILMAISIFGLAFYNLSFGIDFTGGTLMKIEFTDERPSTTAVEESISDIIDVTAQPVDQKEMSLRMKDIPNDIRKQILDRLNEKFNKVDELSFESIGPSIGKELRQKAILAIIIVLMAIILYITWAFRKVSYGPVSSWVYGTAAVIALIHDILIVTGLFAFLSYFAHLEIDSLFVTALLTILGFSVHDTIVVFDRIREVLRLSSDKDFETVINESINQTIIRSLNTSLTALFVLTILYLFGGESIKYFVLALIVGIITGTYSSIYIASPLLLVWEKIKQKRNI